MRIKFRRKCCYCFVIGIGIIFLLMGALPTLPKNIEQYEDPLLVKGNLLCVLVPYRDRYDELKQFIPYMEQFLNNQGVEHRFIVLNQTDSLRFNRASLINVGWFEADRLRCNYLVMHDVDLLPKNPDLSYAYPGIGVVRHLAPGKYHPKKRYDYPKFIGGILVLTLEDYKLVNGMSNKYWGWGLEDDEFYLRLRDAHLLENLQRPDNLDTGRGGTFLHIHDPKKRARDQIYTPLQKQMSHRRDRVSGLFSVNYNITDRQLLKFDGISASVVNVELICDKSWTPYCTLNN